MVSKPQQAVRHRWLSPRFLPLVWVGPPGQAMACAQQLDASPGWRTWLSQLLNGFRLAPSELGLLRGSSHPLVSFIANEIAVEDEDAREQSVSVLGIDSPTPAMQRLLQRAAFARASSSLSVSAAMGESNEQLIGSIVYDPRAEALSIKLDAKDDDPDVRIALPHSAWMYQFIADLSDELKRLGCVDVKVRILDKTIQGITAAPSFRQVH